MAYNPSCKKEGSAGNARNKRFLIFYSLKKKLNNNLIKPDQNWNSGSYTHFHFAAKFYS